MPLLPTFWTELKHLWNDEVEIKGGIINTLLMKDEDGAIHYSAIFMVYFMPLISMYIFYLIMHSSFEVEPDAKERTAILEIYNAREKARMDEWLKKHPGRRRVRRKWE